MAKKTTSKASKKPKQSTVKKTTTKATAKAVKPLKSAKAVSASKVSSANQDKTYLQTHTALVVSLLALVILIIAGVIWWNNIYVRPRNVFEDMLKNNLATKSITKKSETLDGTSEVQKAEQTSFVPNISSRTLLEITQPTEAGETKVVTESIGTLQADFSQYTKIDTAETGNDGKKLDYSKVLNIWGRSSLEAGQPQNFQQSILGLVPFADLRPNDRQKIIAMLINDQAYKVDYSKVEPKKLDGYSALVFPVSINTAKYLKALKELSKVGGFADLSSLDPAQYEDNAPIEIKMVVDKRSRKLLEVEFIGAGQKETYSSYGLSAPIVTPENPIKLEELQKKIQEVR